MKKIFYITNNERKKCQKVASVYANLENEDILLLDAGRYGFVKLQYYEFPFGFKDITTFTDSQKLFDDLWEEWLNTQLLTLAKGTPMEEMWYNDIFKCLPKEKQKELLDMRIYFKKKAGIK